MDQTQGSYSALLHAIATEKHADFEAIPIGYVRKMVNPESAFTFDMDGGDSHTFDMVPPPAFASAQAAAEMVELYWQAAARDIPFTEWSTSSVIAAAAAELSSLSGYAGPKDTSGQVTPDVIFRGTAPGCLVGPYISQYLLKTIYFGSTQENKCIAREWWAPTT